MSIMIRNTTIKVYTKIKQSIHNKFNVKRRKHKRITKEKLDKIKANKEQEEINKVLADESSLNKIVEEIKTSSKADSVQVILNNESLNTNRQLNPKKKTLRKLKTETAIPKLSLDQPTSPSKNREHKKSKNEEILTFRSPIKRQRTKANVSFIPNSPEKLKNFRLNQTPVEEPAPADEAPQTFADRVRIMYSKSDID